MAQTWKAPAVASFTVPAILHIPWLQCGPALRSFQAPGGCDSVCACQRLPKTPERLGGRSKRCTCRFVGCTTQRELWGQPAQETSWTSDQPSLLGHGGPPPLLPPAVVQRWGLGAECQCETGGLDQRGAHVGQQCTAAMVAELLITPGAPLQADMLPAGLRQAKLHEVRGPCATQGGSQQICRVLQQFRPIFSTPADTVGRKFHEDRGTPASTMSAAAQTRWAISWGRSSPPFLPCSPKIKSAGSHEVKGFPPARCRRLHRSGGPAPRCT